MRLKNDNVAMMINDQTSRVLTTLIYVAALVVGSIGVFYLVTEGRWLDGLRFLLGDPGTRDFIQYWAAFHAVVSGGNPYDLDTISGIQANVAGHSDWLLVMPNPPWLLLIMAPILWMNFSASAAWWMLANLGFLVISAMLIWRVTVDNGIRYLPLLTAVVLFLPAWGGVWSGQVGALLTLGVAGLYWALRSGRNLWIAVFLIILTVKPHLFHLLGVALAVQWFREGTIRPLAIFVVVMVGMIMTTHVWSPELLSQWVARLTSRPGGDTPYTMLDWLPATFPTVVRGAIRAFSGEIPAWPMVAVPLLADAVLAWVLIGRRITLDWRRHFFPILALSLFTAPYGWLWDQATLLVAQVGVVALCLAQGSGWSRTERLGLLVVLAIIQLLMLVQSLTIASDQHFYVWVPLAYLGVWWLGFEVVGTGRASGSLGLTPSGGGSEHRDE